jgi:putative ABC transport system permease protein
MLKDHFRFAWRTLIRHKTTTLINTLGLALGLCACITIYTITHYEFSYDAFHPDKDRIYRVGGRLSENLNSGFTTSEGSENIPPPAPAIIAAIPGIETIAPYYLYNDTAIIATAAYFHILPFEWLAGNPTTALDDPGSIVLTESQAIKHFGRQPAGSWLNRTLTIDDSLPLHVTGIVKDWTENTDFAATQFISFSTINSSFLRNRFHPDDWKPGPDNPWVRTLIKLKPAADASRIESRIAALMSKKINFGPLENVIHFTMLLQPLTDIHFNPEFHHDGMRKAQRPALYGLIGTAVFILLLAIVNFINLSTAQSLQRAKEIGVRKILGGSKPQLILRFLTETTLVTVIAAILAIALVQPILNLFRSYLPDGIRFHPLSTDTLIFITAVITITTLLAGYYPARVLANYAPSLNGKTSPKDRNILVRKALIVFQFIISALFIVSSITAGRQLHYMLDADMGISTNAVITLHNYRSQDHLRRFAAAAQQLAGIKEATLESYAPTGVATIEQPIQLDGKKQSTLWVKLQGADQGWASFYRLPIIAGHDLPPGDSLNGFLINATYCRTLGFKHPADAIGHSLSINGAPSWPITGVVADFHQGSLHDRIVPVLIGNITNLENVLAIRLPVVTSASTLHQTLEKLESLWKKITPTPFNYDFLDESIARLYESDRRLGWLVRAATAVTIFISCMGLLGLAAFTAGQRKKEIAIRKVLGAGLANIMLLLTKDFLILLGIAFSIAAPTSAYALNRWLESYAYRITLSWWIFGFAALTLLAIVGSTIGFRIIRAARQNPVDDLRAE